MVNNWLAFELDEVVGQHGGAIFALLDLRLSIVNELPRRDRNLELGGVSLQIHDEILVLFDTVFVVVHEKLEELVVLGGFHKRDIVCVAVQVFDHLYNSVSVESKLEIVWAK